MPTFFGESPIGDSVRRSIPGRGWKSGTATVINRVNGWSYDSAGNLTAINGIPTSTRSFTYDGENRQVSATISGNTSTYTYDGLGQRVMKVSGGQTTVYAYDAFGNLAAEYSTQAVVSPCGTNTCYLTVDHLGSTRMLTDSSGNTAKLYDYLPFGEELLAGQDGRSSVYSSSPDGLGPKFTGQIWDGESSLYWFNVRHMSGAQGRFQGVDPGNAGADPADPQTWNMYAYVGNNPLTYTDPSGQGWGSFFLHLGEAIFNAISLGYGNQIWGGNALNIGGINGGVSDNPWNEQPPGGLGGSLNTGGIFGSGDTGPFVNNILRADASLESPNYKFYTEAIGFLMSDPRMAAIIFQLQQSPKTYLVRFNIGGTNDYSGGVVRWDAQHSLFTTNGGCLSPATILGHELAHAAGEDSSLSAFNKRVGTPDNQYDNAEERRVITGVEARLQKMFGGIPRLNHTADSTKGAKGSGGYSGTSGFSSVVATCK